MLPLVLGLIVAAEPPAGRLVDLSLGTLWIPDSYHPDDAGLRLLVHLHGALPTVERELHASGRHEALVDVTLNGLSGVYTEAFEDPATLQALLDEATAACGAANLAHLTVSSWSAGFGGVREFLKDDHLFDRIDELVLVDTIYAAYTGDPAEQQVDPDNMTGFLRFAREAAAGRKRMLITHCDLQPEGYASTKETADYLIAQLGGTRDAVDAMWADDWRCTSRFVKGRFEVLGFEGDDGAAHVKHLRYLGLLLAAAGRDGENGE